MKFLTRIIPAILILAAGACAWYFLASSPKEKTAKKEAFSRFRPRPKSSNNAQQTKVLQLKSQDYPILLESHGIVKAPSITTLTPQVSGVIQNISPHFENGSFIKQGDILLELDPSDFQSEISSATASLARAEAALAQEKARAAQALRNWQDIGFSDKPNDLVLRKPQLKEAEANVIARQAELDRANRNLTRTKIRAPYDGRVRSRDISLGQSVGTSTKLGEIFLTSYAEVRLPLSSLQLRKIDLNETNVQSIPITLHDSLGLSSETSWEAHIVRIEGELDPTSRELFVVARIDDPFGLLNKKAKPPLRINQPVTAKIQAEILSNVISLPRSAVYGKDEIILIKDSTIHRQSVKEVWSTIDTILVDAEDLDGELLAISKLAYAPQGSPVRIISEEAK